MTSNNGGGYKPSPEEELAAIDYEINEIDADIQKLSEKKQVLLGRRQAVKDEVLLQKSQTLASKKWDEERFPWSKDLASALQNIFKISNFRPFQLSAMNAALSKEDVILIMPTGGGKSLCYQLPAVVSKGVTVVVCPLVALMEDQIMGLKKLNVAAEMLSNATSKKDMNMFLTAMVDKNSKLKLLYVTPERMAKSKRFMTKLQKMYTMKRLSLIAIDEVHCCSTWGHDFRPDYKFLGVLKGMFPDVPILGLTATATSKVIVDVQKMLNIQGSLVLKATFNRPNLYYEVRIKPSVQEHCLSQLADLLKQKYTHQSGIIYTTSIKECEEIMKGLRERGVALGMYHANLDPKLRSKVHMKWLSGEYQAVVATIAFGLGIDKPDVRFVIHNCLSKSMENFYQESGRAGRDDKPADCILFYRLSDVFKLSTMVFSQQTGLENLYGILAYCLNSNKCRRSIIASHFGEAWEATDCNAMCDHCRRPCEPRVVDLGGYCRSLYKIMQNAAGCDVKLTAQMLIDAWLGKGKANLRVNSVSVPMLDREMCENIVGHLLVEGYFREDFHFTPYSTISYITKGPRAAIASSEGHKITMEIKGKPQSSPVDSKGSGSEKYPPKQGPTATVASGEGQKNVKEKPLQSPVDSKGSGSQKSIPKQGAKRKLSDSKDVKCSVPNRNFAGKEQNAAFRRDMAETRIYCTSRGKVDTEGVLRRAADEVNLCSESSESSSDEGPQAARAKKKCVVVDND